LRSQHLTCYCPSLEPDLIINPDVYNLLCYRWKKWRKAGWVAAQSFLTPFTTASNTSATTSTSVAWKRSHMDTLSFWKEHKVPTMVLNSKNTREVQAMSNFYSITVLSKTKTSSRRCYRLIAAKVHLGMNRSSCHQFTVKRKKKNRKSSEKKIRN
jgi:hypothetical protein